MDPTDTELILNTILGELKLVDVIQRRVMSRLPSDVMYDRSWSEYVVDMTVEQTLQELEIMKLVSDYCTSYLSTKTRKQSKNTINKKSGCMVPSFSDEPDPQKNKPRKKSQSQKKVAHTNSNFDPSRTINLSEFKRLSQESDDHDTRKLINLTKDSGNDVNTNIKERSAMSYKAYDSSENVTYESYDDNYKQFGDSVDSAGDIHPNNKPENIPQDISKSAASKFSDVNASDLNNVEGTNVAHETNDLNHLDSGDNGPTLDEGTTSQNSNNLLSNPYSEDEKDEYNDFDLHSEGSDIHNRPTNDSPSHDIEPHNSISNYSNDFDEWSEHSNPDIQSNEKYYRDKYEEITKSIANKNNITSDNLTHHKNKSVSFSENVVSDVYLFRYKYTPSEAQEMFYCQDDALRFQYDFDREAQKALAQNMDWNDWIQERTDEDILADELQDEYLTSRMYEDSDDFEGGSAGWNDENELGFDD